VGAKKHFQRPLPQVRCAYYLRLIPHFTPLSSFFNHLSPLFTLPRPTPPHLFLGMKKGPPQEPLDEKKRLSTQ